MRYRVEPGMAAWLLHRITGVAVVLFLIIHIFDIALVGWGPEVFNKLLFMYRALPFRILEAVLMAAVLYHALNGIRVILVDFWRQGTRYQEQMFYAELLLFTVLFVPATILLMLK